MSSDFLPLLAVSPNPGDALWSIFADILRKFWWVIVLAFAVSAWQGWLRGKARKRARAARKADITEAVKKALAEDRRGSR